MARSPDGDVRHKGLDFADSRGRCPDTAHVGAKVKTMSEQIHDVIIIGSGPAGYTAAIYLGRAGYAPVIVAGALTPGGQLVNTTEVENFPGFPDGVMGPDLMDAMQRQAEKFGAMLEYNDVIGVDALDPSVKKVTLDGGETLLARALVVATGSSVRKLGVPGEEEYSGHGVSYCATCDGFFFKGKPIVVVGGGDSAMEEADFLSRFGSSVTLIHRRDQFRASRIMVERVKANPKITILTNTVVTKVNGSTPDVDTAAQAGPKLALGGAAPAPAAEVTSIELRDTVTGDTRTLPVSGVFVAIGHTPATAFLGDAVARDADGYVLVDGASTRTNVPGVFAAGDCVDRTYRQAISAAGMGCRAALDAQAWLTE